MKPARELPRNQSASRFASAIERSPRRFTNESPSASSLRLGEYVFLMLLVAVGLAVRLDFLIASNFVVDADEAIVGLMAKHIAEGAPMPVFYYGQHYMGTLEPLLASFVFRWFGVSSEALKAVPLAFSLALIILVYKIGLEIGSRSVARVAALLTAVPPAALVVWSAKARGGFIELVFLGALALLFTVRWLNSRYRSLRRIFAIGLVLGFGWWVNNQIAFFIPPIVFFVASCLWQNSLRTFFQKLGDIALNLFGMGVAFFLGGLPFWLYNIQNNFISFQMFKSAERSAVWDHLAGVFSTSLPILFGAKRFWETTDTFPLASVVAYCLAGFLACVYVLERLPAIASALRFRAVCSKPVDILPLFIVCSLVIFSVSTFGYLVQAPRYLLPIYPALFLVAAYSLDLIRFRFPSLAALLLVSLLGFNLASSYLGGRALPGEPIVFQKERVAGDHAPIIRWLTDNHYDLVRTNYWIGYRLAFETNEQVRFSVFQEPRQVRIESYRQLARARGEETLPLILVPGQSQMVEPALSMLGYQFERAVVGGYVVIHHIRSTHQEFREIPASEFVVGANSKAEVAKFAVDNNPQTRWGSGQAQYPGLTFTVDFPSQTMVSAMSIDLGEYKTDFPRKLRIDAILPDGSQQLLLDEAQYNAITYYTDRNRWLLPFSTAITPKQIVLTETGDDPVFDWSIAELKLYQ